MNFADEIAYRSDQEKEKWLRYRHRQEEFKTQPGRRHQMRKHAFLTGLRLGLAVSEKTAVFRKNYETLQQILLTKQIKIEELREDLKQAHEAIRVFLGEKSNG